MEDTKKVNDEILGFGKKLKVLVGAKEDGSEDIIEYHFTPVSLKNIPELTKLLDNFFETADIGEEWTDESITESAKLIHMSINKMHPDVTVEQIKKQFTLTGIAKAVNIVMDINDFLSEMEAIKSQSKAVSQLTSIPKKKK